MIRIDLHGVSQLIDVGPCVHVVGTGGLHLDYVLRLTTFFDNKINLQTLIIAPIVKFRLTASHVILLHNFHRNGVFEQVSPHLTIAQIVRSI